MFKVFSDAVSKKFMEIQNKKLFVVEVSRNELWEAYLSSYPEGTNNLYIKRNEYDCTACHHFINTIGGVVALDENNEYISVWDVQTNIPKYDIVAKALSNIVKSRKIKTVFKYTEKKVSVEKNYKQEESGDVTTFTHFFAELPNHLVVDSIGYYTGPAIDRFNALNLSLTEITFDAIDTFMLNREEIYRGEEFVESILRFKQLKEQYEKIEDGKKQNFVWGKVVELPPEVATFRNSVIGALLVDLSDESIPTEKAVDSFESKVSRENYKRTKSFVSKAMMENARKAVEERGLMKALERKHATIDDIDIKNMLFIGLGDPIMSNNVFDTVIDKHVADKKPKHVEKIHIDDFLTNMLTFAKSIEVFVENKHNSNFVSLIAPKYKNSGHLFKWDNDISWSYNGNFTDSMVKERVKSAGGNVTGDVRVSLAWYNKTDLDLHIVEPNNIAHIHFGKPRSHATGGTLDVDANSPNSRHTREPVENIFYPDKSKMIPGEYNIYVNNYQTREYIDIGFEVEIDFCGETHNFKYNKNLNGGETVAVARFIYDGTSFRIVESIPEHESYGKQIWGVTIGKFTNVKLLTMSPNFWSGNKIGNKHYFFMLENCINDQLPRGMYNEFLRGDLENDRKALDLVGANVPVEKVEDELSGLGFSSTISNSIICRVTLDTDKTKIVEVTFGNK